MTIRGQLSHNQEDAPSEFGRLATSQCLTASSARTRSVTTSKGALMDVEMRMPDLATVDSTVTLVRWLANTGQEVRRGEPLLEVETDKAVVIVESTVTGTLRAIDVPAGAEVATGQVIATF